MNKYLILLSTSLFLTAFNFAAIGQGIGTLKRVTTEVTEWTDVKIENISVINSDKLEYSPMYFRNGIVFSSTRIVEGQEMNIDENIGQPFMDLFFAKMNNDGSFTKPEAFSDKINTKAHEGPMTFSDNEKTVYFTRNIYNKGRKRKDDQGKVSLKIYSAEKSDNDWKNVKELPFGDDNATVCHPTISVDGKTIYFAAELEGGFGGLDIYKATKSEGTWSKPQNLGKRINSAKNEAFPFLHPDGTLYFSSDKKEGIGGLDIYYATSTGKSFSKPENLGLPFNSSQDDFGIILDQNKMSGFFSSSRKGGQGADDIYRFELPSTQEYAVNQKQFARPLADKRQDRTDKMEMCAYDGINSNKLEGVAFTITEKEEREDDTYDPFGEYTKEAQREMTSQYFTDIEGKINYGLKRNKTYIIKYEKEGYKSGETSFNTEDLEEFTKCIALQRTDCLELTGKVVNRKFSNFIPNTTITILNECTGDEQIITSDEEGKFSACLACQCEYTIKATKKNFAIEKGKLSTFNMNCKKGSKDITLALFPQEGGAMANVAPSPTQGGYTNYNNPRNSNNSHPGSMNIDGTPNNGGYTSSTQPRYQGNNTYPNNGYNPQSNNGGYNSGYTPSITLSNVQQYNNTPVFAQGMVIELDRIFYDYNKSYIRSDARSDLDKLVYFMNQFPSMEVEIAAHTDSRGERGYNQNLSQKRAEQAAKYLREKGIASHRITAKGYGETLLRNNCEDGTNCEEEAHQLNRRTEIKITNFEQYDRVKIQYNDTKPRIIDKANK